MRCVYAHTPHIWIHARLHVHAGVQYADVQTCTGEEHLRGGDVGEGLRRLLEHGARGGGGGQVALARRYATARLEESRTHPRIHSAELRPLARAEPLLSSAAGWRVGVRVGVEGGDGSAE